MSESMKTNKKIIVIITFCISLIIGGTSASSLSISNIINRITKAGQITGLGKETLDRYGVDTSDLGKINQIISDAESVVRDANNYYNQFSNFYQAIVNKNVEGTLRGAKELAGVLGIPDPNSVDKEIEIRSPSSRDPGLTAINQDYFDAMIVEGIAKSTLSKEGQQRLMEQQQQSQVISGAIVKNAEASLDKNITQEVMKVMVQNQAHLGEIAVTQSNQLMNLQVNTAGINYGLGEINKHLVELKAQKLREKERETTRLIYVGTNVYIPGFSP